MDQIPPGARQIAVGFDRLPRWIDGFAQRHHPMRVERSAECVELVGADGDRAWITAPFPPLPLPGGVDDDPVTDLIDHARRPRRIGVILVRRGGHAVGIFDSDGLLVDSKVGRSYVQGTTKAGGWSQHRYARRRDNQARAAFEVAADDAVRVVAPQAGSLDALIVGGDHGAVDAVLADGRLSALVSLVRRPFLAVADPRLKVLRSAPQLWQCVRIDLAP